MKSLRLLVLGSMLSLLSLPTLAGPLDVRGLVTKEAP